MVGAGVVGCAVAYYLARAGLEVTVVEQEAVGAGASNHGTGMVMLPLHYMDPPAFGRFYREGLARFKQEAPAIRRDSGVDFQYDQRPLIRLALRGETWDQMRRIAADDTGNLRIVDAETVYRWEPRIEATVLGAVVDTVAAKVDGYRLTEAFASLAFRHGATLIRDRVLGLSASGDRVTGVRTSNGGISSRHVVLCIGAALREVSEWLPGVSLPMSPVMGQELLLRLPDSETLPYWITTPDSGSPITKSAVIYQRRDGLVSVGVTAETDGSWEPSLTQEGRQSILRTVTAIMPSLSDAEVVSHIGGLRTVPVDAMPIMGAPGRWGGLSIFTGPSGIMASVLFGQTARDVVTSGRAGFAIDSFSPDRFRIAGTTPSPG